MVDVKFNPFLKTTLMGRYPAEVNSIKGNAIHGVYLDGHSHKNFSFDISTEALQVFKDFVTIHPERIEGRVLAPVKVRGFLSKLMSGKLSKKEVYQGLRAEGLEGFDVQKSHIGGWYFFDSDGKETTLGDFIINNIGKFID